MTRLLAHTARHPAAVVFALALALYAPTLSFDFIREWDDGWLVLENPYLHRPHLDSVLESLDPRVNLYPWGAEYLPVRNLSYFLDRVLWGFHPAGWHATQALLHAIASALVVSVLARLGLGTTAAVAGALVYAFHPLQVEKIAWVSERRGALASVLALLAARAWLATDTRRVRDGIVPAAFVALAALSKGTALALPALLVTLDLTRARPGAPGPRRFGAWRLLAPHVPVLVATAGAFALHAWASSRSGQIAGPPYGETAGERVACAGALYAHYARVALYPVGLVVPYPWTAIKLPARTPSEPVAAAGLALFALGAALALVLARARVARAREGEPLPAAPALAALVWWPAALFPALQLALPIPQGFAERYAGLAVLALAFATAALVARRPTRSVRALAVALVVLALALSLARLPHWRDDRALWEGGCQNAPWNAAVRYQLAQHLELTAAARRDPALATRAEETYREVLLLDPTESRALNNLAAIHERRGELVRARELYDRAVLSSEPSAFALFNRARFESREPSPNLEAMRAWLLRALALDPNLGEGHALLREVERAQRGDTHR